MLLDVFTNRQSVRVQRNLNPQECGCPARQKGPDGFFYFRFGLFDRFKGESGDFRRNLFRGFNELSHG